MTGVVEMVGFEDADSFMLFEAPDRSRRRRLAGDLQVLLASTLSREHAAEMLEHAAWMLRNPKPIAEVISLQAVRDALLQIGGTP